MFFLSVNRYVFMQFSPSVFFTRPSWSLYIQCSANIQTKAEFPWQPASVFSGHGDPEHLMELYECDSFPFMVLRMQLYSQVKPIFSACFDGTIFTTSTKHCRKWSYASHSKPPCFQVLQTSGFYWWLEAELAINLFSDIERVTGVYRLF